MVNIVSEMSAIHQSSILEETLGSIPGRVNADFRETSKQSDWLMRELFWVHFPTPLAPFLFRFFHPPLP